MPKDIMSDEDESRSPGVEELFVIREGELPMKTETPPHKIDPFVMIEVVQYGLSMPQGRTQKKRLSTVFLKSHDIRMIGKSRKGRKELENILATSAKDEGDMLEL